MAVLSEQDGSYLFQGKSVHVEVQIDGGEYFARLYSESGTRVHSVLLPGGFREIGRDEYGNIDWQARDEAALRHLTMDDVSSITPST